MPARPGDGRAGAARVRRRGGLAPVRPHPEYPPEGIPLAELHRRYGIGVGERDPLRERFAAAGLEYDRPEVVPNTRLALRLTELARERGLHEPFHDRLMDAYWSEATNIGDPDELRRLAAEVGRGSTFTVELPLRRSGERASA